MKSVVATRKCFTYTLHSELTFFDGSMTVLSHPQQILTDGLGINKTKWHNDSYNCYLEREKSEFSSE